MERVELYRQVFRSYKALCACGQQPCSFSSYCREHGVEQDQMRKILKDEFQNIRTLPGYRNISHICSAIYKDFKQKCASGKQPSTFADFYRSQGITWEHLTSSLKNE